MVGIYDVIYLLVVHFSFIEVNVKFRNNSVYKVLDKN